MSLIIKDDKLLNEYKEICNKFSYNTEKEFDSKRIRNGKYIKIKLILNVHLIQSFMIVNSLKMVVVVFTLQ